MVHYVLIFSLLHKCIIHYYTSLLLSLLSSWLLSNCFCLVLCIILCVVAIICCLLLICTPSRICHFSNSALIFTADDSFLGPTQFFGKSWKIWLLSWIGGILPGKFNLTWHWEKSWLTGFPHEKWSTLRLLLCSNVET